MIKPLAKRVLIPLGLTAAASAADAGIHKKILRMREYNNTNNIKASISYFTTYRTQIIRYTSQEVRKAQSL